MKEIKIIPIGSGSTGNSMFIEIGNYHLLVDMGLSNKRTLDALKANGFSYDDIDVGFLTHAHSDHINGLKVMRNNLNVNIYASDETCYYLEAYNLKPLMYRERIEILPGLYVEPFKTSHDIVGSCGFIFKHNDIKLGYVTDLGLVSEEIIEKLKGSDLVVIEANHDLDKLKNGPYPDYLKRRILSNRGHLSNEDCADAIKELIKDGTKHFLLAHLSKENNTPELALAAMNKFNAVDIKTLPVYSQELLVIII